MVEFSNHADHDITVSGDLFLLRTAAMLWLWQPLQHAKAYHQFWVARAKSCCSGIRLLHIPVRCNDTANVHSISAATLGFKPRNVTLSTALCDKWPQFSKLRGTNCTMSFAHFISYVFLGGQVGLEGGSHSNSLCRCAVIRKFKNSMRDYLTADDYKMFAFSTLIWHEH